MKKKWYEGSGLIACSFPRLEHEIENHGKFYEGVISFMSGISSTELLEQGSDFLIIKTNEGIMKRTNIMKRIDPENIVVEFDEEYVAGKMLTTRSHFFHEFTGSGHGIKHRTIISDIRAPGLLGLIYRLFGSANIGKAILSSHKTYLETSKEDS